MSNSSISPLDRTRSGATTLGQSRPGSIGNKVVLHIPESSKTRASASDCFMSKTGHSLVGGVVLTLCRDVVGVFYNPSRLGHSIYEEKWRF